MELKKKFHLVPTINHENMPINSFFCFAKLFNILIFLFVIIQNVERDAFILCLPSTTAIIITSQEGMIKNQEIFKS